MVLLELSVSVHGAALIIIASPEL